MDADARTEALPVALARLQRFPSVDAFYDDDERRRHSPEWDYGVWWRATADERWPRWRVSWVCETGDLYATRCAGRGIVLRLGNVPPLGAYPYGLGSEAWGAWHREQPVERLLAGWAEGDETLGWILDRLARAAA